MMRKTIGIMLALLVCTFPLSAREKTGVKRADETSSEKTTINLSTAPVQEPGAALAPGKTREPVKAQDKTATVPVVPREGIASAKNIPVSSSAVPSSLPKKIEPAPAQKNSGKTSTATVRTPETKKPLAVAQPKRNPKRAARYYEDALDSYRYGELDDAGERVDKALAEDPLNADARALKDKISLIKHRIAGLRQSIAEEYRIEAEYYLKKQNILDAMLWINRSLKLDPSSEKASALDMTISEESLSIIQSLNKGDSRKLMKGVKIFLAGDYFGAAKIFRSLQRSYPEINDYLSVAMTHQLDKKNNARSNEYYAHAVRDMAKGRMKRAQEELSLALEMDRTNLDARFLLEEVYVELGGPQLSTIGQ